MDTSNTLSYFSGLNHLQFNETTPNSSLRLTNQFNESSGASSLTDLLLLEDNEYLFTSTYMTIIVAVIASLMSFFTIVGNVLVITAFIIDKNLRTYSNYFILNLSLADLLIGLLIPPYAPFLLYNYNWKLGRTLCTLWLVLDYVVGSASVLCIVVISLDRYWLVSRGLAYISAQKISRAALIMATCWFIAFLNYAPAIIVWEVLADTDTLDNDNVCQAGFHDNLVYLTVTACVEFFLPFVSICSLNLAVYMNIRKRSKGLIRTKMPNLTKIPLLKKLSIMVTDPPPATEQQAQEMLPLTKDSLSPNICQGQQLVPTEVTTCIQLSSSANPTQVKTFKPLDVNALNNLKKDRNLKRDQKAARSLFILVFSFVVCWAPYTFLTLVRSVCLTCIKDSVYELTFWLLWFNSTLNPILYPFLHLQFRKAFIKIFNHLFCCMCCMYRNGILRKR